MLRLQIAISNFHSTNYHTEPIDSISLKFASINTTLPLIEGHGGKTIYLEIGQQQMQQIYHLYACGLFIESQHGRYFSLLNLSKMKPSDKIICQEIYFFNDVRQSKFKCQFSIVCSGFKNPKVPDLTQMQNRDNVFRKPPIPKTTQLNNFVQGENNKQISFLHGSQGKSQVQKEKKQTQLPDHLKTLKNGIPKQNQIRKNLQSRQKYQNVPKEVMQKQPQAQLYDDDDIFNDNPPAMQFTNDPVEEQKVNFEVPQIGHIEYADSIGQLTKQKHQKDSTQEKFHTFNRNGKQIRQESPETPSQFQLHKRDSQVMQPRQKSLSREEIKALARQDAEEKGANKEAVMIPIAKGGKFQLVPLSSLKPDEIIDYVQKQRKIEEEAAMNEQRKKKLQLQEKQMQQKNKKLQQIIEKKQKEKTTLQKQNSYMSKKRNSKELRESVKELIEEQPQDEQRQIDDDYESDFQSMSMTGSLMKSRSRISSRGPPKNVPKEEDSYNLDDDYSQDFDSYSQSMLSKTNPQKNKMAGSMSDYSDSYHSISISQSYRK